MHDVMVCSFFHVDDSRLSSNILSLFSHNMSAGALAVLPPVTLSASSPSSASSKDLAYVSSFRFNIYVSGTKPEDAEIVIFLHNDETWSAKVKVSLSTDFGGMFSGPTMYLLRPNTSVCVGFLDHDRIETVPLLGLDGSLRFHFQVQVIIRPGSS